MKYIGKQFDKLDLESQRRVKNLFKNEDVLSYLIYIFDRENNSALCNEFDYTKYGIQESYANNVIRSIIKEK